MSIKNFFNHFRFVSKKKYDGLMDRCVTYRNNWISDGETLKDYDRYIKRIVEENHKLQNEVRKLNDNLIIERNRKPKPIIVKKELCYSFDRPMMSGIYLEELKHHAKEELLLSAEPFVHEEEMGEPGHLRFSIALFPIEDKRFW